MENTFTSGQITLSEKAMAYLDTTRKWTKFLAVLGFIGAAFLIIASFSLIAMGSLLGASEDKPLPLVLIGLIYLVLSGIYILLSWFLLKFSNNAGRLTTFQSDKSADATFCYLKRFFKSVGIMTIAMLSLYVVGIIGAILFYAFSGSTAFH